MCVAIDNSPDTIGVGSMEASTDKAIQWTLNLRMPLVDGLVTFTSSEADGTTFIATYRRGVFQTENSPDGAGRP